MIPWWGWALIGAFGPSILFLLPFALRRLGLRCPGPPVH